VSLQYNRRKPLDTRLHEVETDVDAIKRELDQLRRIRFPQADLHRDIRWAMTVGTVPSDYPDTAANTFPIRFLDAHFTKTAGLRTFLYSNRSTDPVTLAHAATGQYIPSGLPLPVFWQRGLGAEDSGEWWFLDPPRLYVVQLTTVLHARSSALARIWLPDNTFTLYDSGITIGVRDVAMGTGETRPVGTRLLAHWYLTPYPHWIVYPPPVGLAIATLQYDLCGNTATIADFERLDGTTTIVPPTTADNTLFQHRGLAGDKVLLTYSAVHTKWLVIDVTKHEYPVLVGMRRTGDCVDFGCIEADVIQANLEVCSTHLSRVVFCLPPCNDTSVQTSLEQTSIEQTSGVQTSTVGCGDGVIDPGIVEEDGSLEIATPGNAGISVRKIAITVTGLSVCPVSGVVVQVPRTNSIWQPYTSPQGYWSILTNASGYDPDEPSEYLQGVFESYNLICDRRQDLLTGDALSDDPADVEWRLTGTYGTPTLGLGLGGSAIRISETQGGAASHFGGAWGAMAATLEILSLAPFHAIATYTPPRYFPHSGEDTTCGTVQVEFTEI